MKFCSQSSLKQRGVDVQSAASLGSGSQGIRHEISEKEGLGYPRRGQGWPICMWNNALLA